MFNLISRHIRPRRIAVAAVTATFITGAVPAMAQACTPTTTGSPVLNALGDTSLYTIAPGGSFEAGTTGWTLNGSKVQSGNESYHVNGSANSNSLFIPPTSNPVSAPICVSNATLTFRFFAKQAGSGWAEMNINVLWTDASGVSHVSTAGGLSPVTGWGLTQVYDLGAMLPLWQSGSTLSVRIQFVPASTGGPVSIDDIEVDPYSK
jgi:hypothetical protein